MCVGVDSSGGCSTIPLPDKPLQIIHTHTHTCLVHPYIKTSIYLSVCCFLFSFLTAIMQPALELRSRSSSLSLSLSPLAGSLLLLFFPPLLLFFLVYVLCSYFWQKNCCSLSSRVFVGFLFVPYATGPINSTFNVAEDATGDISEAYISSKWKVPQKRK